MVAAVRGAVSLNEDTRDELNLRISTLYQKLAETNCFTEKDIISIIFSQTGDISYNPARALRETAGLSSAPLFCTQEPVCIDFPQKKMLRILITYNAPEGHVPSPVYQGEAASLRNDLREDPIGSFC